MSSLKENDGFQTAWEQEIYASGKMLNRYPYEFIISRTFSTFGQLEHRSTIRFLEVGCGAGNNLWFLGREGFCVSGIDGSKSAIEYASQRLKKDNIENDLQVGDFQDLPWEDNTFDVVIDRLATTHNRRHVIEKSLKEISRVLKPSGLFWSSVFSTAHPDRLFGNDLGDGAVDQFSDGYFKGVALTFFASKKDLIDLYSPYFEINNMEHHIISNMDDQITAAQWLCDCQKSQENRG